MLIPIRGREIIILPTQPTTGLLIENPTLWLCNRIFICIVICTISIWLYNLCSIVKVEVEVSIVGFGRPEAKEGSRIETSVDEQAAADRGAAEMMNAIAKSKAKTFPGHARDYIKNYAATAVGEMKLYGIPASITLAQGLTESSAGTSNLCIKTKNHFGLKCFSRKCRRGHCANFTDDTHKDFFLVFDTVWESFRHHSKMLCGKRYEHLRGKNSNEWTYGLQMAGYATDKAYGENLRRIIKVYDLGAFDKIR